MLIDWFTVGALALNFLVLVWLLQRFLYKPILSAIGARETRIATQITDAANKTAAAQKLGDEFRQKTDTFDKERANLLGKATDEAKAERQRLLDEARKAADTLTASRHAALITDAQALSAAIGRRAQAEVFVIARKALGDLAATSLDERMVEVFVQRLAAMDVPTKQTLAAALSNIYEPAVVRSAFELPTAQRTTLQNALDTTFTASISLRFETAPDLIGGIELSANGQKVSWSIADYLKTLAKSVNEMAAAAGPLPIVPSAKIGVSAPEPKNL